MLRNSGWYMKLLVIIRKVFLDRAYKIFGQFGLIAIIYTLSDDILDLYIPFICDAAIFFLFYMYIVLSIMAEQLNRKILYTKVISTLFGRNKIALRLKIWIQKIIAWFVYNLFSLAKFIYKFDSQLSLMWIIMEFENNFPMCFVLE